MSQDHSPSQNATPASGKERGAFCIWARRVVSAFHPWDDAKSTPSEGRVLTARLRSGVLHRAMVTLVIFLAGLLSLTWHIGKIQLARQAYYRKHARGISLKTQVKTPQRGSILDLNGNKFAVDQATQDVYVEPRRFLDKLPEACQIIAKHLELDPAELLEKFQKAADHAFTMKLSDHIPPEFVRQNALGSIPGIRLRPIRDSLGNVTAFKVLLQPAGLTPEQLATVRERVPECFDINKMELKRQIQLTLDRCREIAVKRGVSREEAADMLQELRTAGIMKGVRYTDSWVRCYPRNNQLANLLGFTDSTGKGVSGIEALMDRWLRPTPGKTAALWDRHGCPLEVDENASQEPVDGSNVYLTIQEPIQRILEEELATLWETNHPDRAYAVMMDPATGAIMGLAQYPQFNPNDRETMEDPDLCQNHILLQCYDPGSIMKPVSLSGVLAAGVANENTMKDCERGRWVYNRKLLRDSHGYEDLTLTQVIQKSSNIGTAKFSLDLGEERMYKHLTGFGFGKRTDIGFHREGGESVTFPSETRGLFRELHQWDSLTITRVPMGQGMTVPLLQVLQAWSALANHGVIMQPYLVDRVVHPDGQVEYSVPRAKYQAVSASAADRMAKILTTVTQKEGTGSRAAVKGFTVAGKTGTAQMWIQPDTAKGIKGHYAEKQFLASFIGFAPAENPRFLLLVSAENPTTAAHTGSGVAAPVFRRIAQRTLEYLQVQPDQPGTTAESNPRKATAKR